MRKFIAEALCELVYHVWRIIEKFTAWRERRAKGGDTVIRESWWARREAAQGYLGTELKYRPQNRLLRLLDLAVWYSPLGQIILWRTKKGDW